MRALVLGGHGFIGQHLIHRLTLDGHEVFPMDLPEDDLTGETPYETIPADGWDWVFLLAARLGVAAVEAAPYEILRDNVRIVQNVLDWLPNQGETLVYASSSEVYAESVRAGLAPVPTPEEVPLLADPVSGRGAYALSKIAGESLVRHGHAKWVILRYHNVYGPGQRRGFVIPDLIRGTAAVQNPSHTRAFCYIDDAVEATIRCATSPWTVNHVINVGSTDEVSIADLASRIRGPVFDSVSTTDGSPPRRCPVTHRLQNLTGFTPQTPLAEGLRKTIEWWKGQP